ncbi:MAG: septum formation family protein [Micropruina sp.]|nr:septum formation family protein [Micropruina sp.]
MRRTWVAAAGIACLVLAGCATGVPRNTAGQVTAEASIDAFQVTVGDCTGAMKEGDVSSLKVIPCDQPHYFEAYARTDLEDGDFPGEDELTKHANTFCSEQFKTFIGLSTKDSAYDMFYLYPVKESWATGDREVLCFVGSTSGKVTGTLKGVEK